MHVLTEINVNVHPVLLNAAKEHFFQSGVQIIAFKLPVWMYEKLKREPGFKESAITGWGQFLGYKVMRSSNHIPKMYENHSAIEYDVFPEDGE